MPTFKYIAYTSQGTKKTGMIEAEAKDKAVLVLKSKGLYPDIIEQIDKKEKGLFTQIWNRFFCRISQTQRAELFFRLSTLLESAVPLVEALDIVASQYKSPLKEILLAIKDKVNEGEKFSNALKQHSYIFHPIYINMISIAERTGNLAHIMFQIAAYEEQKENLAHNVLSALIYPVFVLCLGGAVVSFLLIYVLPKMEKIFASLHKELPFVTKALIWIGDVFHHYFVFFVLFSVCMITVLFFLYKRFLPLQWVADKFLLCFHIYRRSIMARFSSVVSFQLKAGISLVEAISQAKEVVKNRVFHDAIDKVVMDIKDGTVVDKAFENISFFDPMFIASLNTGQKTSRMEEFISRIADYYEREINRSLKKIMALAEPVSILVLGAIVGFIVMAIMVPLFDINQLIK